MARKVSESHMHPPNYHPVILDILRILSFRFDGDLVAQFDRRHLAIGLVATWLAGIGRYWDHPQATLLQHAGAGSVIYVFVLAAFLWLIVLSYQVPGWSYPRLLTFITLTSFPAWLYAIPVERITSMQQAASINAWFLALVAGWRLALLFHFLRKTCSLPYPYTAALTLLPMALIVTALAVLNLEHAVFNIMGGIREGSPHNAAYSVVLTLTAISVIVLPALLVIYLVGLVQSRAERRR